MTEQIAGILKLPGDLTVSLDSYLVHETIISPFFLITFFAERLAREVADAADASLVPGLSFNDEGSLVTTGAFFLLAFFR